MNDPDLKTILATKKKKKRNTVKYPFFKYLMLMLFKNNGLAGCSLKRTVLPYLGKKEGGGAWRSQKLEVIIIFVGKVLLRELEA